MSGEENLRKWNRIFERRMDFDKNLDELFGKFWRRLKLAPEVNFEKNLYALRGKFKKIIGICDKEYGIC